MTLYYVFDDEETAIGAENYISTIGGAPITGVNAATGELEPNATKTERWAIPKERLDGKWAFPYVGDDKVSQYPPDVADYFETTFPNTKEEYEDDWFPYDEEDDVDDIL